MAYGPYLGLAKNLFKALIVTEVVGVVGVYYLYHEMDTSQDFRNSVNKTTPSLLELYYKCNEMSGVYGTRERDMKAWSTKTE